MERPGSRLAVVLTGALLVACAEEPSSPTASQDSPVTGINQTIDQYIVQFSGSKLPQDAVQAIFRTRGEIRVEWPEIGYSVVKGISGEDAKALLGIPGVVSVTQDKVVQWIPDVAVGDVVELEGPINQPHDPSGAFFFNIFQWNMKQIDADDAWAAGFQGDPNVKVMILDTGINPTHPDLAGLVHAGLSMNFLSFTTPFCAAGGETTNPNNWNDFRFHGSHVAGIVTTNGIGTAGVAPHVSLIAGKVLNCQGFGSFGDVIAGMQYAGAIGADVANMSLGATVPDTPANQALIQALYAAVKGMKDAGVLPVSSAGNAARLLARGEPLALPCESDHGACISATGPTNQMNFDDLASYSNFGAEVISVAAPGGDVQGVVADFVLSPCSQSSLIIPICQTGNFWLFVAGTSMAAPHVSGLGAFLDSQVGGAKSGRKLKEAIEEGADDLGNPVAYGHGRINVFTTLTSH